MPNYKRSHEECRPIVCFLCLNRTLDGKVIKEAYKIRIHNEIYPDFQRDENFLPSGLCSSCCRIMYSQDSKNPRKYPGNMNYYVNLNYQKQRYIFKIEAYF